MNPFSDLEACRHTFGACCGKELTPAAERFCRGMSRLWDAAACKGRLDRAAGKPASTCAELFPCTASAAGQARRPDPDAAFLEDVHSILYDAYIEGYQE